MVSSRTLDSHVKMKTQQCIIEDGGTKYQQRYLPHMNMHSLKFPIIDR